MRRGTLILIVLLFLLILGAALYQLLVAPRERRSPAPGTTPTAAAVGGDRHVTAPTTELALRTRPSGGP